MSRGRRAAIAAAALAMAVAALAAWQSEPARRWAIDDSARRWAALAPERYRYTLQITSFATADDLYPVQIEVRGGQPHACRRLDTGEPVDCEIFALASSVERTFEFLRRAAAHHPARYSASFDLRTGAPSAISLDFDDMTTDDAYDISITQVELLP